MDSGILLSIIIPFYNADEWIGKMLDSLLDQDLHADEYEIIIVDDGSTQGTAELSKYVEKYPLIKYHRKENGGPSSARNRGIDTAKGKYILFCDSDDYIQKQVLGKLIRIIEERSLEMLLFDYFVVNNDEVAKEPRMDFSSISDTQTLLEHLATYTSNPMSFGFGPCRYLIRKSLLLQHSIQFEDMAYIEDRIFQLRLLSTVKRMAHIDVDVYFYIQRESSILHMKKRKNYIQYAPWLWIYLNELSVMLQMPNIPDGARFALNRWRDTGVFSLLINNLKYCPSSTSSFYIEKLLASDAYPIEIRGSLFVRLTRRCMNHPKFWIILCRLYGIVPRSIRLMV